MNEGLHENHSSDLFTFTRVNSKKKEPRITVGLTISPRLLDEARNRNLNLSRIFEQALASILDYIPHETQAESSQCLSKSAFLGEASFLKEGAVAGPPGIEPGTPGFPCESRRLKARCSVLTELRALLGHTFRV